MATTIDPAVEKAAEELRNKFRALRAEIGKLEGELKSHQAKIKKIPETEDKKKAIEPVSQEAAQLLPRVRNPIDLIGNIRQKATESGVLTSMIDPGTISAAGGGGKGGGFGPGQRSKATTGGGFDEWSFKIDMEGTCDQIGMFVNKMEEFEVPGTEGRMEKRFFAVRSISITASKSGLTEGGPKATHKCSLSMVTYRESSAPEAGKPGPKGK